MKSKPQCNTGVAGSILRGEVFSVFWVKIKKWFIIYQYCLSLRYPKVDSSQVYASMLVAYPKCRKKGPIQIYTRQTYKSSFLCMKSFGIAHCVYPNIFHQLIGWLLAASYKSWHLMSNLKRKQTHLQYYRILSYLPTVHFTEFIL